ncbi:MAG: hypothetical protein NXI09_15785 [Bacteroidetes bacterium]|nr:hypothetical protein [Bacteroidota bacterium]
MKETKRSKVSRLYFAKNERPTDSYYTYVNNGYYYGFQEFKGLKDFEEINLIIDSIPPGFSFFAPYEILNENSKIRPSIKALWDMELYKSLNFIVKPVGRFDVVSENPNRIILVGKIERLYLTDERMTRMIWSFKESFKDVLLVIEKLGSNVLLITVQSDAGVTIDDLDLLNLPDELKID